MNKTFTAKKWPQGNTKRPTSKWIKGRQLLKPIPIRGYV